MDENHFSVMGFKSIHISKENAIVGAWAAYIRNERPSV